MGVFLTRASLFGIHIGLLNFGNSHMGGVLLLHRKETGKRRLPRVPTILSVCSQFGLLQVCKWYLLWCLKSFKGDLLLSIWSPREWTHTSWKLPRSTQQSALLHLPQLFLELYSSIAQHARRAEHSYGYLHRPLALQVGSLTQLLSVGADFFVLLFARV